MQYWKRLFCTVSLVVLAANSTNILANGSVVINELMWPGSTLSTADEWIELRNMTDQAIDLTGWQITKLNNDVEAFMLEITAGTLPANGYYLISNFSADDSQVSVEPDFVSTSVSLSNSKLQIKLYDGPWDGSGNLIDTADDGVGAPAAGDNTNKYSMMRIDPPGDGTVESNWKTADLASGWDDGATEMGTPGAENEVSRVIGEEHPVRSFVLHQNYPNPFNPETTVEYDLLESAEIGISVYDLNGREVAELFRGRQSEGSYSTVWRSGELPSGTYMIHLKVGHVIQTRKCLLLR